MSNSIAPNHYISDLEGLPNPSFVNPLFIPSSFMERTVSETDRPWLLVLKPSKQQSSIISYILLVLNPLFIPSSFMDSSDYPCSLCVASLDAFNLIVVIAKLVDF